ncbi:hydroxyacylglutathione hydrolase [Pseudaeromonas sharmana]|uniref:Hydroxyacylglutathione hydrolase n=1 Tax=Pseudaeromonas sharmana TaxID=328412 RepID=A0ABV8CSI8_9GAMM
MLQVMTIPARQDNYIWLIKKDNHAVIVDPGEAEPVLQRLEQAGLQLDAILVTHLHHDHIDGIPRLLAAWPSARLFAPGDIAGQLYVQRIEDGDELHLDALGLTLQVLHVPGHTGEHVAYYGQGMLFSGDTLFAAGCGRLLGGKAEQLYASLRRLAALPPDTQVYCAHEYTQSNLRFCYQVEPQNPAIRTRMQQVGKLIQQGLPTIPSRLSDELATNVFLRTASPDVQAWAEMNGGQICENEIQVFAILREKKNNL